MLRYIGGYYDTASGLYKLGARYYDPAQGRFTQYDPTGQERNPYAYGNSDPINQSDPTGTISVKTITRVIDAISAGKSVYDVLTTTGLISFITGAAFGAACTLAFSGLTAGTAIVVAAITCAAAGEIVSNAIDI